MTPKSNTPPQSSPNATPSATASARPWAKSVAYAGDVRDVDDAMPSFMSALRRFRARHGLSPIHQGQQPLFDDQDLLNLRDIGCERSGLNTDDLADPTQG